MNLTDSLNRNRVLVAMSGGVDSSVALLKILEQGYEALGVSMKLWEYRDVGGNLLHDSNCCSIEAINNAKLVCLTLGVRHYTLDFQETFRRTVVDNFVGDYFAGRTPNPCVLCNIYLKWDALIKYADLLDARWIATGHYAIIDRSDPRNPVLRKGIDLQKDQSYVLWGIPREMLKRTLLPLGSLTKNHVRQIAREAGLVTADVPESQEICFVPDNDYRRFLRDYAHEIAEQDTLGEFVTEEGMVLGRHEGVSHYTVGQRRRLGVTGPEPLYVQEINSEDRTVTLAPRDRMFFDSCIVAETNWLQHLDDYLNHTIHVHIRYNHDGVPCHITENGESSLTVHFESSQFAVTPGQSAVFYAGDILLGGGIIKQGHIHEPA